MGRTEAKRGLRSGVHALSFLAVPLNGLILDALTSGPQRQVDIRGAVGLPAQSTLRSHLHELEEAGLIGKRRQDAFPGALEFELLDAGADLVVVAETLRRWLASASGGVLELGSEPAKAATKALVEGWSTTMLRVLAAQPLSLTELAREINEVSYPSLERRLETMRVAGQLTAMPSHGHGTPHAVTAWARRGIAPLCAAARWELQHGKDNAAPIDAMDVEAAFLLTLPLVQLPQRAAGESCMAVELSNGQEPTFAGVRVRIESGRIASCEVNPGDDGLARTSGSPSAWLGAVIDGDPSELVIGPDRALTESILAGLHEALFGSEAGDLGAFQNKN